MRIPGGGKFNIPVSRRATRPYQLNALAPRRRIACRLQPHVETYLIPVSYARVRRDPDRFQKPQFLGNPFFDVVGLREIAFRFYCSHRY